MQKIDSTGTVLLDTHIWIWLASGDKRIRKSSKLSFIEDAGRAGKLGLSAISIWETAMLEAKGRICLRQGCSRWIQLALGLSGLQLLALTPEVSIRSTRLPGNFHGDPADRIIIATAIELNATMVTADVKMAAYCKRSKINVLKIK